MKRLTHTFTKKIGGKTNQNKINRRTQSKGRDQKMHRISLLMKVLIKNQDQSNGKHVILRL